MKIRLFILTAAITLLPFLGQAQSAKIGYVDVEKIFSQWPEVKQANTILQEHEQKLSARYQAKIQDLQTKAADYQQNAANMDAVTRQDTETELKNLQTQIQQYEVNAQKSVSDKNSELLKPLQEKFTQTVDAVAKESGYTHVLNRNATLLFTSDTAGNLTKKVAQKLGFTLTN